MATVQTIREAKIVIHLEQGKTELRAPDLSKMLADQQKYIDLQKQLEEQLKRVEAAQRAASSAGSGGGSSSGGGGGGGGTHERDRQKTLDIMQKEEQAIARLRSSMIALGGAAANAGEGFFRIARAAVLLGASNDSLQQMIKSLAQVQAYWDLFAGTVKIIQSVLAAQKALAAAQASYVVALGASTLATQFFTVALIEALAALSAFLIPLVIVGALVASLVVIWDLLTESEDEAAESAKKYGEEARKAAQESSSRMNEAIAAQQKVNDIRRAYMTLEQQSDSLRRESSREADFGRSQEVEAARGGGAESQHLQDAVKAYHDVISLERERLAVQTKIRDAAIEEQQEKIKQIEAQERLVDAARQQEQIERDKLRAFQAQVGALPQFEQQQLIQIRDKLRAGQDINQFEEDFFAQNAGPRGQGVINERRAKRGEAAGFGDDFLDGLEGAGKGVADASDELAKAVADLAKLIGDAGSAAEAKARYEQRIKEINAEFEEFLKSNTEIVTKYLGTIATLNDRIRQLEEAAIKG